MSRPSQEELKEAEGNLFKRLRLNKKLSQEFLSQKLGVALSSVRRWEKNQCEPRLTIKQVKIYCELFDQSLDDLPDNLIEINLENSN